MANPIDLCTIDDLQAWVTGISPGPEVQIVLPRLITAASVFMLGEMNRDFLLATAITERRNGNGNYQMVTKQYPINSVASVSVNGVTIPASPDGVAYGWINDDTTIYIVGGNCGYNATAYDGWPAGWPTVGLFTKGVQNVILQYNAGYASIPQDVTQACIELVAQKYRRRQHVDEDSQSLGGQVISFSKKSIPPEVQDTCDRYKYRAPIGS